MKRAALALGALALAACAPSALPLDAEYSDHYSRRMFDAGYSFINERYIAPVSLRELSASGLAGLRKIDASVNVRPRRSDIEVRYRNQIVGHVPAPGGRDPGDWSEATVNAIALARAASPILAGARAEDVFKAVFDGVLEPLDDFSRYDGAATASEKRAYREGFGGIGVTVRIEENDAHVIGVNEDGPAADAGMRAQDRITHVDGEPVAGWPQRRLIEHLRGPAGTDVSLTVKRPGAGAPIAVRLTRRHVIPETVRVRRDRDIAVIRLSGFNARTAKRLERLVRREMRSPAGPPDGFVLDLRSNPGGRLDISADVADIFLDGGNIILTRGRHPGSRQVFRAADDDSARGRPIIVLINGNSASAAEIVAAALQDHGRAVVIGTNSFGKGTVQSVLRLPNEGEITLTWSRFLAPSGYRLHELGILPSVCTHGGGELKSASVLVPAVRGGENALVDRLDDWRATGNADSADRASLRQICPSDGASPDVDVAVARTIIADGGLYASLLRQAGTSIARR